MLPTRTPAVPGLAPLVETNFSMLSHTSGVAKDEVKVALASLFARLGEVVAEGLRMVELRFGHIGTLRAERRRVRRTLSP